MLNSNAGVAHIPPAGRIGGRRGRGRTPACRIRGFELGDVSHADDGVEGCADFMAHVGEEGALGLGGGEGIFPE